MQLELLWNLQHIDNEIQRIKKDESNKENYKRLCAIKEEYNSLKGSLKEKALDQDKNSKIIVRLNVDLKHLDQKVKENNQKLYEEGASLKIIENLQKEIEMYKKKIDETEDELLQYMESSEKADKQREYTVNRMAELKKEFEELKKRYTEGCEKAKNQLKSLASRRETLIKELEEDLFKKYDQMACKITKPLSQVVDGICTECGFKLNAILYDSVKHKKSQIYYCDHCGRILYMEE